MDGWMDYTISNNVTFNSNSVILGGWAGDDKRLSVIEPRFFVFGGVRIQDPG